MHRCSEIRNGLHLFNNGHLLKRYIFAVIELLYVPDSKFQYGLTNKERSPHVIEASMSLFRHLSGGRTLSTERTVHGEEGRRGAKTLDTAMGLTTYAAVYYHSGGV